VEGMNVSSRSGNRPAAFLTRYRRYAAKAAID